jgi:conjugal transfer pilus assembly protein TraD
MNIVEIAVFILLWYIVFKIFGGVVGIILKLFGVVRDASLTTSFIDYPYLAIFIGITSYFIARAVASIRIIETNPFVKKLKEQERKRRAVKVNHARYYREGKREGKVYIGYDRLNREGFFLDDETRTRHIHILGSTGSGKSVLLFNIFKQDIEIGGAAIFIDAKGDIENLERVRKIARDAGREKDLLIFRLDRESNTYNPLLLGNATQKKDKIISSIRWSEVYYERVSENILQLLFSAVSKRITLKDLYNILTTPTMIYEFSDGEKELACKEYINFCETHKREKTTLTSEIGLLVFSDFYKNLDTTEPEINFFDCIRERKILYFGIDVQSYQETSKRIGRIITEEINTTSGIIQTQISERERRYVSVIIDEFQAFGTENFINCLSRGRSSRFMITITHQSLADLEMIKPGFSRQVIDNTYTKIVLPIQDPETIQTIADIIGTYKEYEHTAEITYSGPEPEREKGTVKLVDEYIIHPNDIRQIRIGEAVYKSGRKAGIIQIPFKL